MHRQLRLALYHQGVGQSRCPKLHGKTPIERCANDRANCFCLDSFDKALAQINSFCYPHAKSHGSSKVLSLHQEPAVGFEPTTC
jgi:hypothetical protein